jgi:DNA-binding transcriptional ArsR family regulator
MNTSKSQEVIEALNHPLRRELLRLVISRGGVTVREGAQALGEPLSNVRYHIMAMDHRGVLERVDTKPVGYSRATYWGATQIIQELGWVLEALDIPSSL